jgi:hypothetical protein
MDMERSLEDAHLAQANHHIARAEASFTRQKILIKQLAADGHDTTVAQRWLLLIADTLQIMREHRQILLSRLSKNR